MATASDCRQSNCRPILPGTSQTDKATVKEGHFYQYLPRTTTTNKAVQSGRRPLYQHLARTTTQNKASYSETSDVAYSCEVECSICTTVM